MIRVLSWNIGSFSFLRYSKYLKYLKPEYKGQKIFHEYFLPVINGELVSRLIKETNPEILFLQEFYFPEDAKYISALENYPHKKFLNTWYHEHSILVASKHEFAVSKNGEFYLISFGGFNFFPIHLNSFSVTKRLRDCLLLKDLPGNLSRAIILGDTNIWSRGDWFLFNNDRRAYKAITERFIDFSKDLISTTCFGFGLDKVFGSSDLKVSKIESPRVRGGLMDHYPVVFEVAE